MNKTKSGYFILRNSALACTDEESCCLLQFDGLSQPNPGVSTAGAVLFSPTESSATIREPIFERGIFIDYATNNQAEYTSLLIGLQSALELNVHRLLIEGDSQLVISQTAGLWKVKNEALQQLHTEVLALLKSPQFEFIAIRHVYRKNNTYADGITNKVFASRESFYTKLNHDLIERMRISDCM
jgi:ribonuclease HI